jgi:hypothetical protein
MKFYDKLRYQTLRIRELFGIISKYKQIHSCTKKNCKDCIRHDGHYYCAAYDRFMDPKAIPCLYAIENELLIKKRKYRLVIKRSKKI